MTKIVLTNVLLMLMAAVCSAKEWRGIVPLHSTCEDVKRVLMASKCEASFDVEDGKAFIKFSLRPCADGWNVPIGTVLEITFYPKSKPLVTELEVDLVKYKKEAQPNPSNYVFYTNNEEGVTLTVTPDDRVYSFHYYPASKDSHLRYGRSQMKPSESDGDPHGTRKFDEYGNLVVNEEQARLDGFAQALQSEPDLKGFIIVYGGRRTRVSEPQTRSAAAKNYLIEAHRIDPARILIIEGGYREQLTIELFIGLKDGAAPSVLPTVCPSEVQFVRE